MQSEKKDEGMKRASRIERKEKEKSRQREGGITCGNRERENIDVNREEQRECKNKREGKNTWRDRERNERKKERKEYG